MPIRSPIRSLGAAIFITFCAFTAPGISAEAPRNIISIAATGTVTATPDMAIMTSGVVTQGKTARQALDENTQAMGALINVLKDAGIEEKYIQTSNFSVQPNFVHSNKRDANGYTKPPRIDGYRVSNNVAVRIMDLEILGDVLDRSVTVGANTINGVQFAVQNPQNLLDEARARAMKQAIAKASIYTNAANVALGDIINISENTPYQPQPVMAKARMEMAMDAPVPVMSGELDYSITVNVQWEIEQ